MIGQLIDFSPASQARKYIQKEFFSEKWKTFRTWFFETYTSDELKNISEEFYEICALHNKIILFVPWFMSAYLPSYVKIIERSYQNSDGSITQALYPPQSSFILPNNTGMTFSAFQKFISEDVGKITVSEINNLIAQNNYLSLYVKVLGEHISSMYRIS